MSPRRKHELTAELVSQRLGYERDVVADALATARKRGLSPVRAIANLGLDRDQLVELYCALLGIRTWPSSNDALSAQNVIELMPLEEIRRLNVLPVEENRGTVVVALSELPTPWLLRDVTHACDRRVEPVFLKKKVLDAALAAFWNEYQRLRAFEDRKARIGLVEDGELAELESSLRGDEIDDGGEGGEIVRTIKEILADAVEHDITDVLFQPQDAARGGAPDLWVRSLKNGRWQEVTRFEGMAGELTRAAKTLAAVGTASDFVPDSKSYIQPVNGQQVEWRVSVTPTVWPGCASICFRRHSSRTIDLPNLGFSPEIRSRLLGITEAKQGLVLFSGGVGHGKSTTIYALLQIIGEPGDRNIITAEDPAEHRIKNVVHTEIYPPQGYTYAAAHRAFMRMQPDVMFFGEVRDQDTASVVLEAAETGHLVFSTIHAKRAHLAANRLIALLESTVGRTAAVSMVADQLSAVMEQRLVRKLCVDCRVEASEEEVSSLLLPEGEEAPAKLYEEGRRPCATCGGDGAIGRVAVGELLLLNSEFRAALRAAAPEEDLEVIATTSCAMEPLSTAAWRLCKAGVISIEQYLRIVKEDVVDAGR